jgi:hypothetical protein
MASLMVLLIPELKLEIISSELFIFTPLYFAKTISIKIKIMKIGIAKNND